MKSYNLNNESLLSNFVENEVEIYTDLINEFPYGWNSVTETKNWREIARYYSALYVMESHTYFYENKQEFDRLLDISLTYSLNQLPKEVSPVPTIAAQNLSSALLKGSIEKTKLIAERVLFERDNFDQEIPQTLVVELLAGLVDADMENALRVAEKLKSQCDEKQFDRNECTRYSAISKLAISIINQNQTEMEKALNDISKERHTWVKRELSRWQNEKPCELTTSDLWDSETSAILTFATALGLAVETKSPFFDMSWFDRN